MLGGVRRVGFGSVLGWRYFDIMGHMVQYLSVPRVTVPGVGHMLAGDVGDVLRQYPCRRESVMTSDRKQQSASDKPGHKVAPMPVIMPIIGPRETPTTANLTS